MIRFYKNSIFLFLLIFTFSCHPPNPIFDKFLEDFGSADFDILIEGGNVVDGTGIAPFEADVLVKDGRIVYVGKASPWKINVKEHIKAEGKIVSPGFIDTHSHGDPLEGHSFENFLAMGVTSITLGQDGFSPEEDKPGDWFQKVDSINPELNIIPFIGHANVRKAAKVREVEKANPAQILKMQEILGECLQKGYFGMSTGLEYVPGIYAAPSELLSMAEIVGQYDGMIMSHMRNEDNDEVETSIKELLNQGTKCRVHVSHLKAVYGKGPERANEILALLDSAQKSRVKVTADVYPYTASYTGIAIVFPDWCKTQYQLKIALKNRRKELEDFIFKKITARNGPEATLFATKPYKGKTLAEVAKKAKKSFVDVLIDDIGPEKASAAYFVMDEALQETFICYPDLMICSDGRPTMRHPRSYGTFAKMIEEYVVKKKKLSIEQAIYKMTWLPAQTLGLEERGRIAIGYFADLVVFDLNKVKALADFSEPFRMAKGFDVVIVNGKMVRKDGKMMKKDAGKLLRKKVKIAI